MKKGTRQSEPSSARTRSSSLPPPPSIGARFGGTPGLDAVIGETVALFHRLKEISQQVHGQGELSSGRWGVLRDLDKAGPQTVPQMARSRPVSRQYIQTLVDWLLEQELGELQDNPAHKRSPLVHITKKGKILLGDMNQRAAKVFKKLQPSLAEKELHRTASTLRAVRQLFEGKKWEQALKGIKS